MGVCSSCGATIAAEARFCAACGSPNQTISTGAGVPSGPPSGGGDRRVATILFSDLVGFTSLAEETDPEMLRVLQDRYFDTARTAIERHGGTVEKYIGDAVMAVFGYPVVREDDGIRAIRAALEIRRAVDQLGPGSSGEASTSLAVRIGLATGEVLAGDASAGGAMVTGDAVNVAARLQQAADPGEILASKDTVVLVRHAVDTEPGGDRVLKGRAVAVEVSRVLAVRDDAEAVSRRLDGPFVGRDAELETLASALDAVTAAHAIRAVTLVGSPGVGKSRLVHEFLQQARQVATVVRGRCLPYGDGIAWWPLVEILQAAAGIVGADDRSAIRAKLAAAVDGTEHADLVERRLATVVGAADEVAPPQEIAWAVRRLLEHLTRTEPVVVVVDDIQWADPSLLDLFEHVADRLSDARLLLVTIARPELADVRPGWMDGRDYHRLVRLDPLGEDSTGVLLETLLLGVRLPPSGRRRILEAADGNPLFLEQILAMFVDQGVLVADDAGWRVVGDLGAVSIPPTIGALLGARLERLSQAERDTIERASVVGKVFWWGSVAELTPQADRPAVGGHLSSLVRREFIRADPLGPDATIFPGDEAFRFRHLLVRDAAYARLPKTARADLHERFATWLEARTGDAAEYDVILGYHLEEAVRYRRELGSTDEATARLADLAARHLGAAAQRAYERTEAATAVSLFTRTLALLPTDAPERRGYLLKTSITLVQVGRVDDAEALLAELDASLVAAPDERWELTMRLRRADRAQFAGEPGSPAALEAIVDEAIGSWERLDDPALGARAWELRGQLAIMAGSFSREEVALAESLRLASLVDDRQRVAAVWFKRANRAPGGHRTVSDGIAVCEAILAEPAAGIQLRATAAIALCALATLDDRLDDARRWQAEGRRFGEEIGAILPTLAADWPVWAAYAERWLGDPFIAEGYLRDSVTILRQVRDHWHLGGIAVFLAECILLQPGLLGADRLAEVEGLIDEGAAAALDEDRATQAQIRITRGRLLLAQGDIDGALAIARPIDDLLAPTEEVAVRIEGWLLMNELEAAAGQPAAAHAAAEEALKLARLKESRLFERLASERLAAT